MDPEQILQAYIEGKVHGEDNKLQAAIGKLNADRSRELGNVMLGLSKQIYESIFELKKVISDNADKIIESNTKLSISNEKYAKWMKWLTIGLVTVGIAQVLVALVKN